MKLSKLYSNKPDIFTPINFIPGLNVIMAEIRLPENRYKDTHNLGKTILGRLIDFNLLSRKTTSLFLFKNHDLFKDFIFFLEVDLGNNTFITIRRSVQEATKIAFHRHPQGNEDLSILPPERWAHWGIPIERAKKLLDSLLDWRVIKPWSYRNALSYLLRTQQDFGEVFQLHKFGPKHADWKPALAQLLGFNSELIEQNYQKDKELAQTKQKAQTLKGELVSNELDINKIVGLLQLKDKDLKGKQALLNSFDFRGQDKEKTEKLVSEVDTQIADLNERRYSLSYNREKIKNSLKEQQILFNPNQAQQLFNEAGVFFGGQIKRDFEQLIAFNRAITEERSSYLAEELIQIEGELKTISEDLNRLGETRAEMLAFLGETDVFNKYQQITSEIISLGAEVETLENQRTQLSQIQELRTQALSVEEERRHLCRKIEAEVYAKNADLKSRFSTIRLFFSEIIESVISHKALLSVGINQAGHLDFKAEILDAEGHATSADLGHTYRKLLCVAFDMAVLRAYLGEKFPRCVYHDGVWESLDDRKKEKLLAVLRSYAELGIQPIITLIDSDLPRISIGEVPVFSTEEVVLTLHDEGEQGRLFKMQTW